MSGSTPASSGRLTIPEVAPCVWLLYQVPSHVGGHHLHAVLDDQNLDDHHIVWAINMARDCSMCRALGQMILLLTKTQRRELYQYRRWPVVKIWSRMRQWGYRLPKHVPTDGDHLYLEAYLRQALVLGPHVSIPSPPHPKQSVSPPSPPSSQGSNGGIGLFQLPTDETTLSTRAKAIWAQLNQPPWDDDKITL